MVKGSQTRTPTRLVRAERQPDGAHTSEQLTEGVRRGISLRVRRGIYVNAEDWILAPPWRRYLMAAGAVAMKDSPPIFCRETALLLHGLPLLRTPSRISVRTPSSSWAGTKSPPALIGAATPEAFRTQHLAEHPEAQNFPLSRLKNIPTHYLEPAIPPKASRGDLRTGDPYQNPEIELASEAVAGIEGPQLYRAEPLGLALVDTLSRAPHRDAVVVLDSALRTAEQGFATLDLATWLPFLSAKRRRRTWERAWAFADARSESPGESLSRVLIHESGLAAPSLQSTLNTDAGAFRADFCWEHDRVLGEFDGRVKYFDDELLAGQDAREVLYLEKQREDALRRAGWTVIRWGWQDLRNLAEFARRLRLAGVSSVT